MAQFTSRSAVQLLFDCERVCAFRKWGSITHFLRKLKLPLHVKGRSLGSFGNSFSWRSGRYSTDDVRALTRWKMNEEAVLGGDLDGDDYGGDDELSCFRGLVLDLAYRPVNVVCWKRAICLELLKSNSFN